MIARVVHAVRFAWSETRAAGDKRFIRRAWAYGRRAVRRSA